MLPHVKQPVRLPPPTIPGKCLFLDDKLPAFEMHLTDMAPLPF